MANITQTIPALTAGISQQPDEQKIPGQVNNMVNALPDITQGLLKRPAGKFVKSLSDGTNNSTSDGKWFHYYRDENEQYVGQITKTGVVKMWRCSDGQEMDVLTATTSTTTTPKYTFPGVDWVSQSGTVNGYINPIKLTGNPTESNAGSAQNIYNTLNGLVQLGDYANNIVGDKVVVTNITNSTGLFQSNVEMEMATLGSTSTIRIGFKNGATGPTTGSSGSCTIEVYPSWKKSTELPIDYLAFNNGEDIQTLTLNDFTYINNRTKTVEMANLTEPLGDFGKEVFVELKSISYAKQYALNLFDNTELSEVRTATRIRVDLIKSSNNYCNSSGNMVSKANRQSNSNTTRCDKSAGASRDAFAPNVGTKIFNVSNGDTITDTGAVYQASANVDETHTIQVKNSNGANVTRGKDLYFRVATTGQSVPFSEVKDNDGTKYNDTVYRARYTTTYDLLHGGQEWKTGDNFVFFMKNAVYQCTIEEISTSKVQGSFTVDGSNTGKGIIRPSPTPFDTETTITAESIIGAIRTEITGDSDLETGNGFTCQQIGNGLHIKRDTAFNGATPVGELLNVVAGKVNDVGDLPTQCKHGMVVEVVNSEAEQDNYFVKFFGNNDKNGEGTWEECAQPGRKIKLKKSTMPVVLIRAADGTFRLTELDGSSYNLNATTTLVVPQWDNALCGDEVTNPEPSFVGKEINKLMFFRNRFCILADENIVMSRPGDFTNFFAKSAIQLIASDPIDISASSKYPAILYDGLQTNTGLVLFSKNQQFMLTTDSDVFSPTTAKINALSTYNFNFATNPISLGTTVGFLDNAGKFSRFFEMTQIQREGEPEVIEQSAVVSRLFEKDLKLISNSRENSVIFFSEEGTSTLYGYRYFDNIRERKLAAWFRWTLTGTIQYHCMQDDFLYVVVRNNNKDQLLKYAIKMDSNTFAIAENRVHLDHLMSVTTGSNTYNATTNKTTFPKPTGIESTNQLAAYDVDSGDQLGRYGLITINGSNLEIDGNWSSQTFLIGHQFTMQVDLPTIYYVTREGENFRADTRSSLVLHRAKLGFGPVGLYETTLNRTGRVAYTELFELTGADQYAANTSSVVDDNIIREVPIFDANTNVALTIKSTHPAPATIHNLTWEGAYNTKFYQRV